MSGATGRGPVARACAHCWLITPVGWRLPWREFPEPHEGRTVPAAKAAGRRYVAGFPPPSPSAAWAGSIGVHPAWCPASCWPFPTGIGACGGGQCKDFWPAAAAAPPGRVFSQRAPADGPAPSSSPGSRRPPHPPRDRPFPGDKAVGDSFDAGSTSPKMPPACQPRGRPATPPPAFPIRPGRTVLPIPRVYLNCHS